MQTAQHALMPQPVTGGQGAYLCLDLRRGNPIPHAPVPDEQSRFETGTYRIAVLP